MALPTRPTRTAPALDDTTTPHGSWLMLAVLLLGQFMCIIDVLVTNVAMPSIAASLHASGASLQLVVGGYTIAYAMLLITGARLGDRYGRRRAYLAGVLVALAGSAVGALAIYGLLAVYYMFNQLPAPLRAESPADQVPPSA